MRSTSLDRREIDASGDINVRLSKTASDEGGIVAQGWHRFTLSRGADIDGVVATVNANLAVLGYPAIGDADVATLKADAAREWAQ